MGKNTNRDEEDHDGDNDGTITTMRTGENDRKKGSRDSDVSWAVGKFFFLSFIFFLTNKKI